MKIYLIQAPDLSFDVAFNVATELIERGLARECNHKYSTAVIHIEERKCN